MPAPETPKLTVDCVVRDGQGRTLLIRRGHPPFEGAYALPGGFIDIGETVEDACRREVREETGIGISDLELLGVYSDPKRDPRGHSVSVVYLARAGAGKPIAGDDAASAEWFEDWSRLDLAFDHAAILADADARIRRE